MKKSVRWYPFFLAMIVGCLVNMLGDWIIGVRIELFWGLQTFNFLWFLQLFIWPIVVGISVSFIYGLGGKWIAMLPPLVVRWAAYLQTEHFLGVPQGADLMPMGWWGFFVILAMETSMLGGVLGEILIKRVYGRSKPEELQNPTISENSRDEEPTGTKTSRS